VSTRNSAVLVLLWPVQRRSTGGVLVAVGCALDQFVLGQLKTLGLPLPCLLQRTLGLVFIRRQLGRTATDLGGLGGCGPFLLKF